MEAFATGRLKVHKTEHTAAERLLAHIVGNSASKSNDRLARTAQTDHGEVGRVRTGAKRVLAPQPSNVALRA
jgi:hypothetical protein